MAFVASRTRVEQLPPALSRRIDRTALACDEVIERRIVGDLGSLVGRDRTREIARVGRRTERLPESFLVLGVGCDPCHRRIQARLAHLDLVDDREGSLLLKRRSPAVPELRLVK